MTNNEINTILVELRNKGAAWQSQRKANSLLLKLKEVLQSDEYIKLKIAHSHYLTGEGTNEFYDVCNELCKKYK